MDQWAPDSETIHQATVALFDHFYILDNSTSPGNDTTINYYGAKGKFLGSFNEIYIQLIIWATATIGAAFFFAGCWGARISKHNTRFLWLPIVSLVVGCIFGGVQALIISALIASIFTSIGYQVGIDVTAAIGISQGLIFLYFHLGRADFIHT